MSQADFYVGFLKKFVRETRKDLNARLRIFKLERKYDCSISSKAMFSGPVENIKIGAGTRINRYCNFRFKQGCITIGSNVLLAQFVTLVAHTYHYRDASRPITEQGMYAKDVVIEDDVWIGANVTVMPGVRIGKGAVIGANAVVTQSVPAYEVWAGVPATKIGQRQAL
jgi:acetyltransferase-like isoleucine patch superfamily enzyme